MTTSVHFCECWKCSPNMEKYDSYCWLQATTTIFLCAMFWKSSSPVLFHKWPILTVRIIKLGPLRDPIRFSLSLWTSLPLYNIDVITIICHTDSLFQIDTSAGRREFSINDMYAFISALSFISISALVENPCQNTLSRYSCQHSMHQMNIKGTS